MKSDNFFIQLEKVLDRLNLYLSGEVELPDWERFTAFRWQKIVGGRQKFQPIKRIDPIALKDLKGIDKQKNIVLNNTERFVRGVPANNVLLTGARGTGKSSIVKAVFNKLNAEHLRLIEVNKDDLNDIPIILDALEGSEFKFLLFCDDLSFESNDSGYKALKAVLDGSLLSLPDNILIYATSNRRHLMPEYFSDNADTKYKQDEIHPSESIEESISLSERFGLWVSFYPCDQKLYLSIMNYWVDFLANKSLNKANIDQEALQWAIKRGSRSGRVAKQFAIDWVGKNTIELSEN